MSPEQTKTIAGLISIRQRKNASAEAHQFVRLLITIKDYRIKMPRHGLWRRVRP